MKHGLCVVTLVLFVLAFTQVGAAEDVVILDGTALTRVVPTSFYFEGQSGPTQMRNSVAVRFGEKHHVIVALMDTAGYSSDVRAKYEGFIINDSKLMIGDKEVGVGAYGFGVSKDSKFNLFDIGGNLLVSIEGQKDTATKTPRPLSVIKDDVGVRLYRGRSYVNLTDKSH